MWHLPSETVVHGSSEAVTFFTAAATIKVVADKPSPWYSELFCGDGKHYGFELPGLDEQAANISRTGVWE